MPSTTFDSESMKIAPIVGSSAPLGLQRYPRERLLPLATDARHTKEDPDMSPPMHTAASPHRTRGAIRRADVDLQPLTGWNLKAHRGKGHLHCPVAAEGAQQSIRPAAAVAEYCSRSDTAGTLTGAVTAGPYCGCIPNQIEELARDSCI